jgi:protein-S-isoprenylcysteine O-methyltransferase Ste14
MTTGEFFFKHRGVTPYPIVLMFALFAEPTAQTFLGGALAMAAGEIVRIWSVAYLGRDSRKTEVQAKQLVTAGPYAFTRNPIYIGNMFLYSGATVISNLWLPYFLPAIWVYFGFQYYHIVKLEEKTLEKVFGSEYQHYRRNVPQFIPNFFPATVSPRQFPDYKKALISEKSTFISIAGILTLLAFRMVF